MFCYHAYGQILKNFQVYFDKKKNTSFSCFKMKNRYRNQFTIGVWSKY